MSSNSVESSMDRKSMFDEYYLPGEITDLSSDFTSGQLKWYKHGYELDYAFKKLGTQLVKKGGKELFQEDYPVDPVYNWAVSFPSERSIRLQLFSSNKPTREYDQLMIPKPIKSRPWLVDNRNEEICFSSEFGLLKINKLKFGISVSDIEGKELVKTIGIEDNRGLHLKYTPFSLVKNAKTNSTAFALSSPLRYNERIYGCGESFTSLNKNGQRLKLNTTDVQSALTSEMYKPVPFFISDQGYGIFFHSSTPIDLDFGLSHSSTSIAWVEDEVLDVFFFIGSPKEILKEYTSITGRSPMPPTWSFGLWMSRLSYNSQSQVLDVAKKLRKNKIPADVIHIDAGWFENGMNCDFEFSNSFEDPKAMISDLLSLGFKSSLWQIPYINSNNPLYKEIVKKELYIKEGNGTPHDVILDFSNPETQKWYSSKIDFLLNLGVAAIKADFGEEAPRNGTYSSKQSGLYEHNLYPLRYTDLLYQILKRKKGDTLIWARSSWAGGQRYPVHWSGDSEVSNEAMASTLKAGLSLGLSGFTFWSHDIGGFSGAPEEDLFLRWTFMGMFSSHCRIHGLPPREPWLFSNDFLIKFRSLVELRYQLLPYLLIQSKKSSQAGLPLIRPLFLEFENDETCRFIEDQFMFGEQFLIAPIFENKVKGRKIYLPKGKWVNYFTNQIYKGEKWHFINSTYHGLVLVKSNSCIPHVKLSQSISEINWSDIIMKLFSYSSNIISTELYHPDDNNLIQIELKRDNQNKWKIEKCEIEELQIFVQEV